MIAIRDRAPYTKSKIANRLLLCADTNRLVSLPIHFLNRSYLGDLGVFCRTIAKTLADPRLTFVSPIYYRRGHVINLTFAISDRPDQRNLSAGVRQALMQPKRYHKRINGIHNILICSNVNANANAYCKRTNGIVS